MMNAIKKALILKNYPKLAIWPRLIVELFAGGKTAAAMASIVIFFKFIVLLESSSSLKDSSYIFFEE